MLQRINSDKSIMNKANKFWQETSQLSQAQLNERLYKVFQSFKN